MEELFFWIVIVGGAIGLAVMVIGLILWTTVAALARVLSIVVVYWGLTFLGALLAGVVVGAVLPALVLAGKGKAQRRQLTPKDLVEGTVARKGPRTTNAEYGWDPVWPSYMPYQAVEDARGVGREASRHGGAFWAWFVGKMPAGEASGEGRWFSRLMRWIGRSTPKVLWTALMLPLVVGYVIGIWISTVAWFAVMGVLGALVTLAQAIALGVWSLLDVAGRRRLRASIKCPHCYAESRLPGYHCAGEGCTIVHWSLRPGATGLLTRRCSCGTQLPNTVSAAARRLAPLCPHCRADLAEGSGARQTVQLAMIGSIAAGKSRLAETMITEVAATMSVVGGTCTPLTPEADEYLTHARNRRMWSAQTEKTAHQRPAGLPFLLEHPKAKAEIQVLDAAGEAFASWDETSHLRYLDTAAGIVLVLDPLALPSVREHVRRSTLAESVLLATGDQEDAYAAAVDRLRAESVPLDRRALAVVLTKADVLLRLPLAAGIDPADGDSVRRWLLEADADLLVRRLEKDFRSVRYFVVDSMSQLETLDPRNPWWVVDWLLAESRSTLRLGQLVQPRPEPTTTQQQPVAAA